MTMAELNIEKIAHDIAEKAIQELKNNGVLAGRWIPVSERLPEKDDLYLICFDNGEYELDYFSRDTFNYSGVVAWLPLPKPYKAESEVQDADSN